MIHLSPFFTAYFLILAAVIGSAMGSFVCCFAYRFLKGESVLKGRSKCDACGHTLGFLDLVPVISYIALGGKCRYCKSRVSPVCLWSEVITGAVFAACAYRFDITWKLFGILVFVCVLLAIALIDIESFTIPDRLIIIGIAAFALVLPFEKEPLKQLAGGLIGGGAVAAGLLALSVVFDKITGKESLGGGDIKLFFVAGLFLGPLQNLLNLIFSCIAGIIFAFIYGKKHKNIQPDFESAAQSDSENGMLKRPVPFGPAISVSTVLTLLFGQYISSWYMGLF